MHEEKWEALWEDKTRTPQRLNPKWEKTPIWLANFDKFGPELEATDSVEYWIRWWSPELRQQQIAIVGPFNRQEVLIQGFLRDLGPHERQWQTAIWNIYQALDAAGWEWADERVQSEIGANVQRSWNCRKFGSEHHCPMEMLCFRQEGWQVPLGHGFVCRSPRLLPELDAALQAGVIPPEVEVEEEELSLIHISEP